MESTHSKQRNDVTVISCWLVFEHKLVEDELRLSGLPFSPTDKIQNPKKLRNSDHFKEKQCDFTGKSKHSATNCLLQDELIQLCQKINTMNYKCPLSERTALEVTKVFVNLKVQFPYRHVDKSATAATISFCEDCFVFVTQSLFCNVLYKRVRVA